MSALGRAFGAWLERVNAWAERVQAEPGNTWREWWDRWFR